MAILERAPSLEEFLRRPEEEPALEYEEGRITQKVSPKGRHGALQVALAEFVNRFARPRRLARAFTETRTTFAGASRVPDVVVYRWERIPASPSGEIADDFLTPPDLAVEIVSPEQSVNSLVRRCLWYVAHGVQAALLVDPSDRSLVLFRPDAAPHPLTDAEPLLLPDLLPGFQLTPHDLFAELRLQ